MALTINPMIVRKKEPEIKNRYQKTDLTIPKAVIGTNPFEVRLVINHRNKNGSIVCDITKTQTIPMMDIPAMERKAGCCAKIKTPSPEMVVKAESKIEVRMDARFFFPAAYSCCKPSIVKIL